MLGLDKVAATALNKPTAQSLLEYFEQKINNIRQSTGKSPASTRLPPSVNSFDGFRFYSSEEIRQLINTTKTKSCALDPIPTSILKEFLNELLPFVTEMCNRSLQEGWLPQSQRHAIVTPIIKKPGLDPEDAKNY